MPIGGVRGQRRARAPRPAGRPRPPPRARPRLADGLRALGDEAPAPRPGRPRRTVRAPTRTRSARGFDRSGRIRRSGGHRRRAGSTWVRRRTCPPAGVGKAARAVCDERVERGGVVHGEFGQHAAVDLDAGELEALDEPVVGHAARAGRGVDPLDPQPAEVALARLAVAVGVDERVGDLLLRLAVQARPLTAVSAGALEDFPALLLGVDRPLHACHVMLLACLGLRAAPVTGARSGARRVNARAAS